MKDKERLEALEAENEELKNRVSMLEGYVLGLKLALAEIRRQKDQPWTQPWTIPNHPYIGTPIPPYAPPAIWCKIDG